MKHAPIIELVLAHGYYQDGRCPDLAIDPTDDTSRLLRNHRCVLNSGPSWVRILTQLDDSGQPFVPLPATATVSFRLTVQNPDFLTITDLSALSGLTAPLYTNAGQPANAATTLQLAPAAQSTTALAPGTFANVDIQLVPAASGAPPQLSSYQIGFTPRTARWVYYCVTDRTSTPQDLKVVDTTAAGSGEVLSFSTANRTLLEQTPDPTDPIGVQLVSMYPTMRCVRLVSDAPIVCREQPRKNLELRLGDERLTGPLPNPSPRDMAKADQLYRIIKYRTQPFQNP